MAAPLEVADIFRRHGADWRAAHAGHVSGDQGRVMAAIEACRTAALGGHAEGCGRCGHVRVAYNSCRNRHCPKCQGLARAQWLEDRQADLLPVPYFHVVFTVPAPVAEIAFQNKAMVYAILFRAAAETLRTLAADPRHLGAEVGGIAVLHTWGQALQHHPHVHCIVPGGGPAPGGGRWVACRPGFFLPVRVMSRLFRRLFLERLDAAFAAGTLRFFSDLAGLADPDAFARHLAPLRQAEWVVYAKPPFGGPEQVLAYLGRYTHRVALTNSRLLDLEDGRVRFRWKDYRRHAKAKVMSLEAGEFIRRFLLHVLPAGFHRIRHFGFLANGHRRRQAGAVPPAARGPAARAGPAGGRLPRALPPADRTLARRLPVLRRPDDAPGRPGPPRAAKPAALARHVMTVRALCPTGSSAKPVPPDRLGKADRCAGDHPERRGRPSSRHRHRHAPVRPVRSSVHCAGPRARSATMPGPSACRQPPAKRTIPIMQAS